MFDKLFIICYNSVVANITLNIRITLNTYRKGGGTVAKQINFLREASQQRTVALYKDQEEKIQQYSEKLGKKLGYTDIIREGVDIILEELEKRVANK